MRKILKIQAYIFLALTLLSFIALKTPWLPIMMLLGAMVGPFMAYDYPYGSGVHIVITLGFLTAGALMYYGIKQKTLHRGIFAFIGGYWLWTAIGLFAGLSTGT